MTAIPESISPEEGAPDVGSTPVARPRQFKGRTLPHSIEAEENLLSCCLLDGRDVLQRCRQAKILPESFYDVRHGLIYRRLLAMFEAQLPIDIGTLAEELRTAKELERVGGFEFLAQVSARTPTTVQAAYFIDKVREQWILREVIRRGSKLVEDCHAFTGNLAELLGPHVDWFRGALSRVVHGARAAATLEQRIAEVRVDIAQRASGQEDRSRWVATGLETFDRALLPFGADAEDHVVLLGGGSGHGKSALMRQFSGHALRAGQRVLNYTRETSVKGYIRQLASHWARVDLRTLSEAPRDHVARYDVAAAELEEMANRRLFVFQHEPGCELMTVEDLMQHARDWAWQHGAPHLLVVDYLQLFGTKKRTQSREQEVAHVSHCLQALQRELGCVMLVGAQYNEAGLRDMKLGRRDENGKLIHRLPSAGDFRESQAMYHDADRVIGLYRPPEDCRGNDQSGANIMQPEQWIVQIKRRYGGEGSVRCWFEKRYLTFKEFGRAESDDGPAPRPAPPAPKGDARDEVRRRLAAKKAAAGQQAPSFATGPEHTGEEDL